MVNIIPYVPRTITVHLGLPGQWAENLTVDFPEYVKNVASSEIYPTWDLPAIRANVLAIISFALNRVYTEFYPSRGYNFQITSTTQYDQKFIRGRNIFENISQVVDEIFNDYIRRQGFVEPLAAKFCNGTTTTCDGLSQWGSQSLAQQGYNSVEILKHYYGNNIELVVEAPIRDISLSYPGSPLRLGDTGPDVVVVQAMLNRISQNYPAIPKVSPAAGVFNQETRDAVVVFQRIFNLTQDGIVGKATWYKMVYLYVGVLQLSELISKGQTFYAVQFQFPGTLREGDRGGEVEVLQYMLSILAELDSAIQAPAMDGIFGQDTARAVRECQRKAGLLPDAVVDEETWNAIYDAFVQAEIFFQRDTVRAQSQGEAAIPVLAAPVSGIRAAENGPRDFSCTPRLGQYPGGVLHLGDRDEAQSHSGEVMV